MKRNKQKGITLIALIITIIVTLILVSVTIHMVISGGLFDYTGKAVSQTKNELHKEQQLANGVIEENGVLFDSIQDYFDDKPSTGVKIKLGITGTNVTEIPVPEGFTHKEGTIEEGYVIQDGDGNEFVWVPVDKEQKITLEVESKEDIKKLEIYNPYGELIWGVADGDIEKTYRKVDLEPTVNGMYMAVITIEKGENQETVTTQKTITVKSLYALDTMNDWYTSNAFARTTNSQTIKDYLLKQEIEGKKFTSVEQALDALDVPTLEVALSKLNTTTIKKWKNYEDIDEDYKTYVETNGGFYIGRYEAGLQTPRPSGDDSATVEEIITKNGKPVSKEGFGPYNYVSYQQALGLAESMYEANNEYEVSLITGPGWDRTLGWIQETRTKSVQDIVYDSGSWGNYKDVEFKLTKGKYYDPNARVFKDVSEINNQKVMNTNRIFTTGSTERNSAKNVFDMAGNMEEWTKEINSTVNHVSRGGYCYDEKLIGPVFGRYNHRPGSGNNSGVGFRAALYIKKN